MVHLEQFEQWVLLERFEVITGVIVRAVVGVATIVVITEVVIDLQRWDGRVVVGLKVSFGVVHGIELGYRLLLPPHLTQNSSFP